MKRVLVTGASGFVGSAVVPALEAAGWQVVRGGRSLYGAIGPDTDWGKGLEGTQAVVHLAALAHRFDSPGEDYLRVNAEGTRSLARACAQRGIGRVIFLSSVKAEDPSDFYGASKRAAERALEESGLSYLALRSPLVYGPGVKANFLSLMRAVDRGLPLPLGSVVNRRSFVFSGNLADAVARALGSAERGVFGVSDGEDLSTPELARRLGRAMGRAPRLWPAPPALLRAAAGLVGRRASAESLLGDLCVDAGPLRRALGWAPPYSVDEGLARTAQWYYASKAPRR